MSDQTRQGAVTADSSAAASAYQEQQSRLAADERAMQAGPDEHMATMADHQQMVTHGQAPPSVPDTGGHG